MTQDIDLVIPWVDGNDVEWKKEKDKCLEAGDRRVNRYRDWDNLQYIFRGIEKYMPWIRKIHFVTWGHLPEWLNVEHPKLNIVKHQDYIPEKYLPTFSSHTIEMNLHRIKGVAEQFIYTNDDIFFLKDISVEDFFVEGLPVDRAWECVHQFKKGGIDTIIGNDLEIINEHFCKRETIKKYKRKWFSVKYGKHLLKNMYLLPMGNFTGFEFYHLPNAYLKRTFKEVWEKEADILDQTCMHKFRNKLDVNQWLMKYWQLVSGTFHAEGRVEGQFFSIGRDDQKIQEAIDNKIYKMICLSDDIEKINFEKEKQFLKECLDKALPEKSLFEL